MTNGNKLMLIYMLIQSIYYRISTSCQEDLMKELTEEENLKTEDTRELMASLDKKQKELTEYQTNMVSINKYASDLQAYIA
jgi:transcriptional regulator CtsR